MSDGDVPMKLGCDNETLMRPDTVCHGPTGLAETTAAARLRAESYNDLPAAKRRGLLGIAGASL